jgi:hypothetical protein
MAKQFYSSFVLAALFFALQIIPSRATDQSADSLSMLARAKQLEDLRSDSTVPFVLQAQIRASFSKGPATGEYKLTWLADDRWREVLTLGDFRRVRDGVSGGYQQIRSLEYQPQVIFDIDQTLDFASVLQMTSNETAGKVHRRKIAGIEMSCVEIHTKAEVMKEICTDPATGLVVHAVIQSIGISATIDYSGSITLASKKFPSKVTVKRSNEFAMEITNIRLEPLFGTSDPLPAVDPLHSEFWRDCRGGMPAELLNRPVSPGFKDAA